ncbi:MAG: CoA-binding protein [Acidobacteria bacterium]|nr:MAG: CoA-binding protein [Acidobacteriota bacterium]
MGLSKRDACIRRHPRTKREIPGGFGEGAVSIKEILETYHTIAVVGLSSHAWRPSHSVSKYMQTMGYRIIPVNPLETEVLGEKAYATLDEVPEPFEIVDIFRRVEYIPDIVEAAIRRNARVIWMQQGLIHDAAAARARSAGLEVVMNRCILVEHMQHF